MKKRICSLLIIIVFIIIISVSENANAAGMYCGMGSSQAIYCAKGKEGLPNYLTTSLEYANTEISYFSHMTNTFVGKNGFAVSNSPLFKIYLNGERAFCVDSTREFPIGHTYKMLDIEPISNSIISKLYEYSLEEGHEVIGQIIFWAIGEKNGYSRINYNSAISAIITPDFLQNKEKFINEFRNDFTFYFSENQYVGTGINQQSAKFVLPAQGYRVLPILLGNLANGNSVSVTNSSIITLIDAFQEGEIPFEYKDTDKDGKYDEVTVNWATGGAYSNRVTYTKTDAIICNALCEDLRKAKTDDEKKEILANYYSGDDTFTNLVDAKMDERIGKIYDDIKGKAGSVKLSIYCPTDDNSAQCIIAPTQNKNDPGLASTSCSNYVAALKKLGWSDQEIWNDWKTRIEKYSSAKLVKTDTGEVKCNNRNTECVQSRTYWMRISSIYIGHSPKFGDMYKHIYAPYTTSGSGITCDCDYYAELYTNNSSKIPQEYRESCEKLRYYFTNVAYVAENKKDIKTCNDSTKKEDPKKGVPYAYCGKPTDGPGSYKCSSFLNGGYKSYNSCNALIAKIDSEEEKNKVICEDDGSQITSYSCEDRCKPTVTPKKFVCDSKMVNTVTIQDATIDGTNEKDVSCFGQQNKTAYSIAGKKITSYDYGMSNSYCEVYCWESVTLLFPGPPNGSNIQKVGTSTIESGRVFWWGLNYADNVFGTVTAERFCTTAPQYSKFETDWNNNEKEIMQKYADYTAQKAYYDNINNIEIKSESCTVKEAVGGSYEDGPVANSCGAGDTACACANGCGCPENNYAPCAYVNGAWRHSSGGTPAVMGTRYYKEPPSVSDEYDVIGNRYTGKKVERIQTGCLENSTSAPSDFDWAGKAKSELDVREAALQAELTDRNRLMSAIKSCQTSKNPREIYNWTINPKFSDINNKETWGISDIGLTGSISNESVTTNKDSQVTYSGQVLYCNKKGIISANGGDPCNQNSSNVDGTDLVYDTYMRIRTYNPFEWTYTGTYNIKYKTEHFTFYASAQNDKFTNTYNYSDGLARILGYDTDTIYSAGLGIPVKINTPYGKLTISVDQLNGLGNNGHFDDVLSSKYNPIENGKYTCQYDVSNILFEPDGPCNNCFSVVYRIIDMGAGNTARIFPGKDGNDGTKSRKIGSNWASFITSNPKKFKKITTATNETKTGIYDKKPLYSIELTPTLIGQIRKDNNNYRNNNLDPYTNYKDYNGNDKIVCTDNGSKATNGNGFIADYNQDVSSKSCTSSYITDLIARGKITGTFAIKNETQRRKAILNYKTA